MVDVWTSDQVVAAAPDAASVAAGRKLSTPAPWSDLGADPEAVWGACKGSGKTPYRAQVDLAEPAFKCSCPSRKFPCKHALGLLLLWSEQPERFAWSRPEWVDEWLASRRDRTEKAETRAATAAAKPVDEVAQAKRLAARQKKVDAGMAELDLWLGDLVRRGFAAAQTEPFSFWDQAAARLVDAQAPGLASGVRSLARIPAAGGGDWPSRMLEEVGLLHLGVEGYRSFAELDEPSREDLATLIGFTRSHDDVLAGPRVRDQWSVVGRVVVEDERIPLQRVWLHGAATDRFALLLSFSAPGQSFDTSAVVGTVIDADLVFYPGAVPERALVAERFGEPTAIKTVTASSSFAAALARVGRALAANPFLARFPLLVEGVSIHPTDSHVIMSDRDGDELPLVGAEETAWMIAALTGGHPATLFAEWDHRGLHAVGLGFDGRLVPL